jgi:restriction endonuclease S subunit
MVFKKDSYYLTGGLLMLLLVSVDVMAGRLYRYEDENGKMVLSDQVPTKAISKGYSILNEHGYVVEVVAPALTSEQRAVLEREKAQAREREKLLKTYSGPEDAELARDRQLLLLDDQIGVKKGIIVRLASEKKRQNEDAAALERQGQKVYEPILQKIDSIEREIARTEEEIKRREQEKIATRNRFDLDIQQLRAMQSTAPKKVSK